MASLGSLLKRHLENKGMQQKALASRLNADESLVSKWVHDQRPISLHQLMEIAVILELDETAKEELMIAAGLAVPEGSVYAERVAAIVDKFPCLKEYKALRQKLDRIVDVTEKKWKGQPDRIPWIPSHGPEENFRMMEKLSEQFKVEISGLKDQELFLLFAAIWLHDIGMVVCQYDGPNAAYEQYPAQSAEYVSANHYELMISQEEAVVLANLCRHHRALSQLSELQIVDTYSPVVADRQRLLLAFLMLANILNCRPERVVQRELFPSGGSILSEVVSSWMRNLFICAFRRDQHRRRLIAEVQYDPAWGQAKIDLLMHTISKDLQARLNRIKDILIAEGGFTLLTARAEAGGVPSAELHQLMEIFLGRLGTSRSPNARRVFLGFIASLRKVMEQKDQGTVRHFAEKIIPETLNLRCYHGQLRNFQQELSGILQRNGSEWASEVKDLLNYYDDLIKRTDKEIARLLAKELKADSSLLLIGYSACVFEALKEQSEEIKKSVHVVVLECRNKSVYDLDNTLEYCDGAEWAIAIRNEGYAHVWLSTDASIASVYHAVNQMRPPTHMVVGINCIDKEGNGYSTTGYLMAAHIADRYQTPVFVLAETSKIRETVEKMQVERANNWLPQDDAVSSKLSQADVRIFNPMDDCIPPALISAFLTEQGKFAPKDLQQAVLTGKIAVRGKTERGRANAVGVGKAQSASK